MTFNAILVYSPQKELQVLSEFAEAGKKIDWKPAIILAAAYLEKSSIEKLQKYFIKNKKRKLPERLKKLSFTNASILLYGLGILEYKHFSWMIEIWKERIKIVHQKEELPLYVGDKANKKYGKMINHALTIINLFEKEK